MKWLKPHEMRIGNIVQYEDGKVTTITSGWELDEGMELYPIPLAEEWLLKFGFIKEIGCLFLVKDDIVFHDNNIHIMGYQPKNLNHRRPWSDALTKVFTVHGIQNLYYALTGEELEVK